MRYGYEFTLIPNIFGTSTKEAGKTKTVPKVTPKDVKPKDVPGSKPKPPSVMPLWKVLLHNDNDHFKSQVVKWLQECVRGLTEAGAKKCMQEAHRTDVGVVATVYKELAELYQEQLHSKGLTITIELA